MVYDIDCLSALAHLWETRNFQCTRVIFKLLTVYDGLGTDQVIATVLKFIHQNVVQRPQMFDET